MDARVRQVEGEDATRVMEAEQPVREELRRIASDTAYLYKLARGRIELPPRRPRTGPIRMATQTRIGSGSTGAGTGTGSTSSGPR